MMVVVVDAVRAGHPIERRTYVCCMRADKQKGERLRLSLTLFALLPFGGSKHLVGGRATGEGCPTIDGQCQDMVVSVWIWLVVDVSIPASQGGKRDAGQPGGTACTGRLTATPAVCLR